MADTSLDIASSSSWKDPASDYNSTSDSNLNLTSDSNRNLTSDSNRNLSSDSNRNLSSDSDLTSNLNLTSDSNLNLTSDSNRNLTSDSNRNLSSDSDLTSNLNLTSDSNRNLTSASNLNLTSGSDMMALTIVDPVSASFCLYSLIAMQDRTLEQVHLVDNYIIRLTETIALGARNGGHIGHGLLLLTRKCVAEGIRHVLLHVATHKYRQVRQCYNYIRRTLEDQEDTDVEDTEDVEDFHDHEVTKIARGLSLECCAFQRSC